MTKQTRKSKNASDPQANKCYEWQFKWSDWNRKAISLADCRAIISKACKAYDVLTPPVVSASQYRHFSQYDDEHHRIELVPSHQNIPVALHEATHAIVHDRWPRAQDHGPTFTGIFLDLLEQTGIAPREALWASARKSGLKVRRFTRTNKKAPRSK